MTDDMLSCFLKKDISFYADLLIENEEWIEEHLKRRAELKERLEAKEKELKDHLSSIEEYKIKD